MARKFKEQINKLLTERQIIVARQIDRKTYHSAKAYKDVMENKGDYRLNFYHKNTKKWPGGSKEQWLDAMPKIIDGNIQDYGSGANKLENQLTMEPEMYKEYQKYHTPHLDHYPIPDSEGGPKIFSNLKIVNKSANEARGNTSKDQIVDDILNYAANYGIKLKVL